MKLNPSDIRNDPNTYIAPRVFKLEVQIIHTSTYGSW